MLRLGVKQEIPMKNLRPSEIIRSIEKALLVVLVICFVLGGIGTVIQLLRWGVLLEPSGD